MNLYPTVWVNFSKLLIKPTKFRRFLYPNLTLRLNLQKQKTNCLVTQKSNISTRIDFLLLTSVTSLRAITMCSAFTPDCGYNNSTIILIGHVYCPNTKCLGKLCLHKKLLNLSAEANINARNAHLCARCGIFFLKIKQISFSCRLVKGFTFLKVFQN